MRTGAGGVIRSILLEPLPGGARWRYVFGHALFGTFLIQFFTGALLMTSYVPSSSQAWGSVWFINTQMVFGWFIRGLHHFGSSAMMVLLVLHLIQVFFTAAYRAPREVNWWLGLVLMMIVLAFALTGYLLPWDQKGYWATKVATNIAGSTPVVGPYVLSVLVGGSEYGNQTLTRLFGLHTGILPITMFVLASVHIMLYYRNGVSALGRQTPVETAWPGQVFRNTATLAITLLVLVGWVLWEGGANLDAPADPTTTDYPARPEWYFLFLFQMLNHFESPYEIIGTMIIPGVVFTFLALLPLLDKVLPKRLVYAAACTFLVLLLGGAGFLMSEAVYNDLHNENFQLTRDKADQSRRRVLQLADAEGVPPDGAVYLLRRDPLTHGRDVLEQKCLSCHVDNGLGQSTTLEANVSAEMLEKVKETPKIGDLSEPVRKAIAAAVTGFEPSKEAPKPLKTPYFSGYELDGVNDKDEKIHVRVDEQGKAVRWTVWSVQSASDLAHYGSKAWLRSLLANPSDEKYFGKVPQCGGMARWRKNTKLTDKELDDIADWFEKFVMTVPVDLPASEWSSREDVYTHPGYDAFHKDGECASCHAVVDWASENDEAPNLYGWGSEWWIKRMIERPAPLTITGIWTSRNKCRGLRGSCRRTILRRS